MLCPNWGLQVTSGNDSDKFTSSPYPNSSSSQIEAKGGSSSSRAGSRQQSEPARPWQDHQRRFNDMSFEEALQTDAPGVTYCTNTAVLKSQKLAKIQRKHVRDETGSGLIATPPTKGKLGKLTTSAALDAAAQAAAARDVQ